ncbi:MAG: TetR/AcrR family transcriptional regulator [Mycobacteriaceae bacterium]
MPISEHKEQEVKPLVKTRPKNRKAQIAATAALAFNERGYHSVGVDEIAALVGVSGPAVYRHFPNKYALLLHAARSLCEALTIAVTDAIDTSLGLSAKEQLSTILQSIIEVTIDNRRTGGLYRWEGRYLTYFDRAELRSEFLAVTRQLSNHIQQLRPELTEEDTTILAASVLSIIGSITAHRSQLSVKRTHTVLSEAAWSIIDCTPPVAAQHLNLPKPAKPPKDAVSKREVLLREAVAMFHRRGFHEVSIEEIGNAAGINASSVYRHFPSKADLLAAAFHRASDQLEAATLRSLSTATSPASALSALTKNYIELSFSHPELISVYFSDLANLPRQEQTTLRQIQRKHVEEWVQLVLGLQPELSLVEARFIVHAALALVVDIGRLERFNRHEQTLQRMHYLMSVILGNT